MYRSETHSNHLCGTQDPICAVPSVKSLMIILNIFVQQQSFGAVPLLLCVVVVHLQARPSCMHVSVPAPWAHCVMPYQNNRTPGDRSADAIHSLRCGCGCLQILGCSNSESSSSSLAQSLRKTPDSEAEACDHTDADPGATTDVVTWLPASSSVNPGVVRQALFSQANQPTGYRYGTKIGLPRLKYSPLSPTGQTSAADFCGNAVAGTAYVLLQ